MDERRHHGARGWERQRRAEQEARLREAEWPEWSYPNTSGPSWAPPEWSQPTTISRPHRATRGAWSPDDSAEDYSAHTRAPTRPIPRAWSRRADQIAIHHDPIRDAEPTVPSLPVITPRLATPRPLVRQRGGWSPARWFARQWHAGTRSRAQLLAGMTALLFTCCMPGVIVARSAYAASDGYHHLMRIEAMISQQGAAAIVNPANEAYLRGELAAAHADFVTLDGMLSAGQIVVQTNGGLQNLARLARLAQDLTGGGLALLDVAHATLGPLLSNPFAGKPQLALNQSALAAAHAQLAAAQAQMDAAAAIAPTITSDGLPGSLASGDKLHSLLGKVGDAARLTRYFALLLDAAPALLGVGAPATYLLLAMDRSELRTGGGFIGNYGILTIDHAHLQAAQLQDTYLLDAAYYARTGQQPPATYPWWPYRYGSAIYGWGLRDSNLAPDFPTNARAALRILQSVQSDPHLRDPYPVRGVIAITSAVMAQIIAITGGSLRLPEYPDHVITPANLDDTIHCFQLGACRDETPFTKPGAAQSADRKHFTAILGQTLVDRVRHLPGSQLKAFMKQVFQDLASKDIQLYFTDAHAEAVMSDARLGGGIAPGTSDTFFVTDTNIGGNKANAYVTQREEDLVTLLPDGSALHRLLIRTTYQRRGPLYEGLTGQTSYWEYRRVYFPSRTRYLGSAGVDGGSGRHKLNPTTASDTPGYAMTGAALSIDDGSQVNQCQPLPGAPATQPWNCAPQIRDEFIYWVTPHAWQRDAGGHIHYILLVQRQAGSNVTLTVRLDVHIITGHMPALSDVVQDYDIPAATSPNGFAGQTTNAWAALGDGTRSLYDGALGQDVTVEWAN